MITIGTVVPAAIKRRFRFRISFQEDLNAEIKEYNENFSGN